MSDRYMTVAAMLDDPENLLCVLREMRRRFGVWPEAASLYAAPWREVTVSPRGVLTPHYALSRLPGVNSPLNTSQLMARVEYEDGDGWGALVTGEGEFGPFDTADEAKREAERILLESGEVTYLLAELPWTPEDDIEWSLAAPARGPYR
jgi:hypothetical protein